MVFARRDIIVLDDVLSAIDARTEALVVNRLFGETGLFRRLGSTVILATHASKVVYAKRFTAKSQSNLF